MENEAQPFKSGDIAYLKSGSPAMTVTGTNPRFPNHVLLAWFYKGHLHSDSIHWECLTTEKQGQ